MADVFLSYSRLDGSFVGRLATALQERGKDVWVDVEGIRDGEVFPEALRRAIEASDAFVFVISPDSVHSPFCEEEVGHAASLNKRIVPLSLRPVPDEDLPADIRFRNWIPASGDGEFNATLDRVVTALDTDVDWERQHSRLTVKTLEWDHSGRDRSFLLRGAELRSAEGWLAAGAGKDPGPTALETEYLAAGRRATARRQRRLAIGSVVVAAVAIGLLIFALISRSAAVGQALTSDAERVGAQALVEKNLDLSMLYAVLGVKLQNRAETRSDLLAELQNNPFAIRYIRPSHNLIASLAVDPRGKLLAMGDSAGVLRFEDMSRWTASGPSVAIGGSIPNEAMAFSPSGDTLAVVSVQGTPEAGIQAGHTKLYTIDVRTRRVRRLGSWRGVFPSVPYPGASLAYDPTGQHIALSLSSAAQDGSFTSDTIRLLDSSTGRVIWRRSYPMRPGQLEARLAFAPDGTLITSAQQGETLLWNARTGHVKRRFPIGGQPAISPDGGRVALAINNRDLATANSRIAILDLHTGRYRFLPDSVPNVWLRGFAFTPDGKTLVGEWIHGDVYIWDVASGSITQTIPAPPGAEASEVLDPTGRTVLLGSQAGTVVAFDLAGSRRLGRAFHWNTPEQGCELIVVNRQSNLMATNQCDATVALVDLRTLRRVATLPARDGAVLSALAFFPDGRTLVTGGITGYLTLWDTAAAKVMRRIKVGEPVWYADVSPNGRLLAAQIQAQNATVAHVQVRSVAGGKPLWTRVVPDGSAGLFFSPNGHEVAALGCCAATSTVVTWDARSGAQLFQRRSVNHATAIAYSPNSRVLAIGTEDGRVQFLNARSGAVQAPALQTTGNIAGISLSPNGTVLAVASHDGSTTLWNLRSRQRIGSSFPARPNVIPDPEFEHNGRLLIGYLSDAAEWPMNVGAWERFACQVAGRDMTPAEFNQILPNRPYMHVCP